MRAIRFSTLILCALVASHALAQDTKIKPGAIKGEVMSFTKARNYEFCEFYIGSGPVVASNKHSEKESTAKGASEDKKADVDWIHSY